MDFFRDLTAAYRALAPLFIPAFGVGQRDGTIGNGETYAPDLRQGTEHNININGAAVTIGNPVLGALERVAASAHFSLILITHVRNISGGAVTITWGSAYRQAAFTDPANGSGVVTMWHFDHDTGLWYSSGRNTMANS